MMVRDEPGDKPQALSNAAFTWASDPDGAEFVHHLNLYGFRDSTWPVDGDNRVMFIGDSFVEGFMAADDETIPRGFELAAADHGDPFETINLGTGASGTDNYLAVVRDAVPIFSPETVILVMYANDFTDNKIAGDAFNEARQPVYTNPYLPRLYTVVSRLAANDNVAIRWSKEPFLFLPTDESSRNPLHDDEFLEFVSGFVAPGILAVMKKGRFNPFIINEYTNYEVFLDLPTDLTGFIEHSRDYVESHGSKLMVVHIPYKGQVSDHYLQYVKQYDENKEPSSLMPDAYQIHAKSLAAECERLGVPFLDISTLLREREANGERMYWDFDEHMKASSYLMVGEQIHRFWKSSFDRGQRGS